MFKLSLKTFSTIDDGFTLLQVNFPLLLSITQTLFHFSIFNLTKNQIYVILKRFTLIRIRGCLITLQHHQSAETSTTATANPIFVRLGHLIAQRKTVLALWLIQISNQVLQCCMSGLGVTLVHFPGNPIYSTRKVPMKCIQDFSCGCKN